MSTEFLKETIVCETTGRHVIELQCAWRLCSIVVNLFFFLERKLLNFKKNNSMKQNKAMAWNTASVCTKPCFETETCSWVDSGYRELYHNASDVRQTPRDLTQQLSSIFTALASVTWWRDDQHWTPHHNTQVLQDSRGLNELFTLYSFSSLSLFFFFCIRSSKSSTFSFASTKTNIIRTPSVRVVVSCESLKYLESVVQLPLGGWSFFSPRAPSAWGHSLCCKLCLP